MIASLVRTDPASRLAPFLLGAGLIAGLILRGTRTGVSGGLPGESVGMASLAVMLLAGSAWGLAIALLMMTGVRDRCGRFSLGLPLSARTLWLARMLSIGVAATIPMATMILVAAVRGDPDGFAEFHAPTVALGFRLLASLLLLVAFVQARRPELVALPRDRGGSVQLGIGLVLSFLVAFAPVPAWWMTSISLVLTGVLIGNTYRNIPEAFSLSGPRVEPSAENRPIRTGTPRLVVARVLVNHAAFWSILPVLLLYGFLTTLAYYEGNDIVPILLFPMIWVPFVALHSMSRIGSLDPLPVPRRRLFRWIVLPPLAAYMAGCALAPIMLGFTDGGDSLVRVDRRGVRLPNEFWELSVDGPPPAIVAPWGESHSPRVREVFPGATTLLFNPFGAPEEASPRYVAWQARRAVARVKGNDPAAVPAPDPHDPLLTALQGRQERGFRMNLEEAFETRSPSHARTMLLLSVFPIAFWLFVGWLGMHPRLARRSRSVLLVLVLALPIVVVVATEFVALSSGYASAPASILAAVVTRRVGELLPLATGVLVAGVSFMGVGVYLVLGRAFERFEAPRQTAKACAMGWRSSNS